jgi:hypothetical protein
MMNPRMAVSALSMGVLLLGAGTTPADQGEKGKKGQEASLQLPITGTFAGGTFAGTLSIQKFAATPDGMKLVAIGFVRGTATSSAGAPLGSVLAGPISLPVSRPEPGGPIVTTTAVGAAVVAQATCQVVHIELGAVNLNVLGLIVTTQPIVLDLSGDTAGPLGNLVCTLLETVNTVVDLVGLLNQILGLLTGLLGGILPG